MTLPTRLCSVPQMSLTVVLFTQVAPKSHLVWSCRSARFVCFGTQLEKWLSAEWRACEGFAGMKRCDRAGNVAKMSAKPVREEKALLPRCLAIVLKEKKGKKHSSTSPDSSPAAADGEKQGPSVSADSKTATLTGREIFEAFVNQNKTCYWNPHLEESIRNLKYVGCLHPNTILIGGRDIYMDTVKGAWARKVLRAPFNYAIVRAGKEWRNRSVAKQQHT